MVIKKLFEPIRIGKTWIKNRIAMAPINNAHQIDPLTGAITQSFINFYLERAKGGVGHIITGVFKVEDKIEVCKNGAQYLWPMCNDMSITGFRELADYAHSFGCKIFIQLTAGPGRVTGAKVINSGIIPVSASANQNFWVPSVTCRPLKTEEVAEIVEAFGRATELVANAGLDGVEIHGHEGYLIDQFTTALWNRRSDKYGGNLRGRLTFPIEILQAIRKKVGDNFPVTYRVGAKHFIRDLSGKTCRGDREYGRDLPETIELVKILEDAGYNGFHIDSGCYESTNFAHPPNYQPHGFSIDLVKEIKKAVNVPVIAAGRLGLPELAEEIINKKKADIVALGRALLADPYWPKKALAGKIEDIRPCIGCQEACLNRNVKGSITSCSVNPDCGRESTYATINASSMSKKVLVIGGGLAGMEAARISNMKGHKVTIYEKSDRLGGALWEASVPDFKIDVNRLLNWYITQINKAGIEVKYNLEVTADIIKKENADVVIVATGSKPIIPNIPGVCKPHVITCCNLLKDEGKAKAGDDFVVIGGGLEGCETALWLGKMGKKVTVIEQLPNFATDLARANRLMLLDLLADNGVKLVNNTKVVEIIDESVIALNKNLEMNKFNCDMVVLACGRKANQELYNSLMSDIVELYIIGDSSKPRKIHDAIFEGNAVGKII